MSTLIIRHWIIITAILSITSAQSCPSCDIGCNITTCFELNANDLTFHCRRVKDDSDNAAQVILLHGFPEWSHHWVPLMQYWNDNAIAINAVESIPLLRFIVRICVPIIGFFYITKYIQNKPQTLYIITACDLRGYSPLASPVSIAEYSYNILQTDVWAIADALGFTNFHLIGHDHGAALGWTVVGNKSDEVKGRILSYSALSV
eukprot:257051_1